MKSYNSYSVMIMEIYNQNYTSIIMDKEFKSLFKNEGCSVIFTKGSNKILISVYDCESIFHYEYSGDINKAFSCDLLVFRSKENL